MSGNRLEFAQFGQFDSFDVIRSLTSMVGVADVDLPTPIVTGLKTMYYVDANVVKGTTYYYKVRVWRGSQSFVSEEVRVISDRDEHYETVIALLYFNDGFADETGRIWVNTNITISSESPILGVKSAVFGGNGELRSTTDVSVGSGDFTVEMWSKGKGSLFSKRIPTGTSNAGMTFFVSSSNRIAAWNGSSEVSSSATIDVSALTHKAFVKHGNRLKMFVNGQMLYDAAYSLSDNSYPMQIGAATYAGVSVDFFNGLISMPRISKYARYTDNFTPPDRPFLAQ